VKILIQIGVAATTLGFALLATIDAATPQLLTLLYMVVVGLGIGLVMPCTLVMIQNAAERRDVGSATGAFLFLRSMGGAVGSTLTGVVLAGQFAAGVAQSGITASVDLGALRVPAGTASTLDAATQVVAHAALSGGFHAAFAACAVLAALAFVSCWGLVDLPLRTTS
jgi:hypothetical protein